MRARTSKVQMIIYTHILEDTQRILSLIINDIYVYRYMRNHTNTVKYGFHFQNKSKQS